MHTSLHPLCRSDGSVKYVSPNGHSVLAAVNGPVEVQRRDELPEEAHIEVNVRPHDGVGQVKERHLESIIASTLRDIIITSMFPRQMVQLTLQILTVPADDRKGGRTNPQAESYLPVLPSLLNAACLALLDSSVPVRCTFTCTMVALMVNMATRVHPSLEEIRAAKSLHVLSFSSKDEVLLVESEGRFTIDEWGAAEEKAKIACMGDVDAMVEGGEVECLHGKIRSVMGLKVTQDERWKDG